MLLDASPEPVSNRPVSFTEDTLVPATLLLTFKYPLVLPGMVLLFTVSTARQWLAPGLVRALYSFVIRLGGHDESRAVQNAGRWQMLPS